MRDAKERNVYKVHKQTDKTQGDENIGRRRGVGELQTRICRESSLLNKASKHFNEIIPV